MAIDIEISVNDVNPFVNTVTKQCVGYTLVIFAFNIKRPGVLY